MIFKRDKQGVVFFFFFLGRAPPAHVACDPSDLRVQEQSAHGPWPTRIYYCQDSGMNGDIEDEGMKEGKTSV